MYAPFFGLQQEPFSIAPDPRYLFMSERHREALAHLLYGLSCGGGFVLLTGEIGTGKTTVCRCFLEQVPQRCNVAYIFNPKLNSVELLQSICDEFHLEIPTRGEGALTVKSCLDPLNSFLLREHAAGRDTILVIDEAQNLSTEVLEQLRLLTNLETSSRKLLQVVLIGQPELREIVARPELEQLSQRIVARYHLSPLNERETAYYVRHRLAVAGLSRLLPFDRHALRRVHRHSRGVPRRINLLCDRALLGAYARDQGRVTAATVREAAGEVFGPQPRWLPRLPGAALAAGMVALAMILAFGLPTMTGRDPAAQPVGEVASPAPQAALPALLGPPQREASVAASALLLKDARQAWRELALQWQLVLGPAGDPCAALAAEQIQCFRGPMSLPLIRQLDRPGILTLDAASASPSYALLVALTDTSATLRAGGVEQTVTLRALAARWQGEFATLWRAPPAFKGGPRDNERESVLSWAAGQLAAGESTLTDASSTSLRGRLRTFQLSQGLPVTGTLTPATFMQLNRAGGIDEPRLRPAS